MPLGATVDSLDLFDNPGLSGEGLRVVLQELTARQLKARRQDSRKVYTPFGT